MSLAFLFHLQAHAHYQVPDSLIFLLRVCFVHTFVIKELSGTECSELCGVCVNSIPNKNATHVYDHQLLRFVTFKENLSARDS